MDLIVFSRNSMRATQSRLALAHGALLERKIALLESDSEACRGSVTLIEGEVGVGKTHFVVKFISDTLFNTCPVYFSPASAFSTVALGPFMALVRQFLDTLASARAVEGEGIDRTVALCRLLRRRGGTQGQGQEQGQGQGQERVCLEELYLDAPLLDEELGTDMRGQLERVLTSANVSASDRKDGDRDDGTNVSFSHRLEAMSSEEVASRRFRLYLYLVLCIGAENPAVIIIDDAQSLDDDSWALLLLLSQLMNPDEQEARRVLGTTQLLSFDGFLGAPQLMVVATFRPLVKHRSVFKGKSAPYEALVASPTVMMLKLDGLPPEEVEELLVDTLQGNIASISEDLYKLVELKCMANPWMIKQLLEALQTASPPVLRYRLLGQGQGQEEDGGDGSKAISRLSVNGLSGLNESSHHSQGSEESRPSSSRVSLMTVGGVCTTVCACASIGF